MGTTLHQAERGCISEMDADCSDRPSPPSMEEKRHEAMAPILAKWRLTTKKISSQPRTSKGPAYALVHDAFRFRKILPLKYLKVEHKCINRKISTPHLKWWNEILNVKNHISFINSYPQIPTPVNHNRTLNRLQV